MAENITNAVVPPIHPSAIMDSMQFGGTGPNDNSNRAATTKYVKNNITNSWVNPSVNTTTNDTQLFVRAKKGSFVANTLPAAGTDYSQSIAFMDGQNKTTMDSSIGYINVVCRHKPC